MMDLTRELSKAMEVIGAGNDAHRFIPTPYATMLLSLSVGFRSAG